jgi:hypothetical protein
MGVKETAAEAENSDAFSAFLAAYAPHIIQYRHIRQLVAVLQRVADGDLKRLMVFMPPRHGKSEIVSRWFPGRCWMARQV